MQQIPVGLRVLMFITEAGNEGRHLWDVERVFPDSQVRTILTRLEQKGLVRTGIDGNRRHGKLYIRTGMQLGPQQKLEVFLEVPA